MARKAISRGIGILLILAALVLISFTLRSLLTQPRGPKAPRVGERIDREARSLLLITLDTTRADHLEPYGATDVATPTLARLAQQGVVFDQAYAVAPITLVAHTSILTGLYPPQHGVRNNGTHYVPQDLTTLAEHLRDEGYRTAAFVSAAVLEKRYGLDQGFEVYDDDLSTGRERHPRMVPDRPAEATVDAASRWLETLGEDDPYFLWIHLYDPHASYSPPAPYRDQYRERLYDGEIAYMDAEIGRLLRHERIESDRELAIFVLGDHGESLGEHGEQTHAILAYDSTLRIPWIARFPGGPAGARFPLPVSQVDLLPTLLDLFGMKSEDEIAGESLVPYLEGVPAAADRGIYSETYLPYYTYGWAKLKVMRQARWKYLDAPTPELFDLMRDPRELSNRHDQEPGRAHDLKRDLEEFLAQTGDADREASLSLDSDALEKLRSLGYLAVGSGAARPEDRELPDPKEVIGVHVGLERARGLARDRLFEQAVQQVRGVLERDPNNLAALIDIAGYLERNGEIEAAVQSIERALNLDPEYPQLYLSMANLEARRGNHEKALELVDRALELDPRSLSAQLQRAVRLRQLRRLDEVDALLATLLAENPDSPQVLTAYAQSVDLRKSDFAAAEAKLTQALERDPFLVGGWRLLGESLERSGKTRESADAYRNGLLRQPDDSDLHARLGLLLARTGGEGNTEMHLREAVRLAEGFRPELHVALGGWLAEHGRFGDAEKEYEKVLEVEPRNAAARNNRAIAFYRRGRFEEALEELRSLVEEFPQYADAHNNLAAVAVERRDWTTAERHSRRALELNPRAPQALNNLGLSLEQTGQKSEAREAYEQAIELEPLYWQARFNLGVLLSQTGRPRAAAEAFQKVVEQVPEYPEVHYQLGGLFAGPLTDPSLARRHFNAFLRMVPATHPWTAEARRQLSELPVAADPS